MISLAEIAKALDCDFRGNGNLIFSSPAEPLFAKKDQIAIALDKKFENQLYDTKARGAIIGNLFDWKKTNLEGVVLAEKTKITLSKLTSLFQSLNSDKKSINHNSFIDPSSKIGSNPNIGSFVFINKETKIGQNANIGNFVDIGKNVIIGDNCLIKSGVKISDNTTIGDNFISDYVSRSTSVIYSYISTSDVTTPRSSAIIGKFPLLSRLRLRSNCCPGERTHEPCFAVVSSPGTDQ